MKCEFEGKDCHSRAVKVYDGKQRCRAHAVKDGLIDDTARIAKSRKSLDMVRTEKRRKGAVVSSKLRQIVGADVMLGNDSREFDLSRELPLIRTARLLPLTDKGDEKYALMMWLVADTETRKPQTIDEVGVVLGIDSDELMGWMRSREFVDVFNLQRNRFMHTRGRLVDMILLTKCMEGERWAVELFYERFGGDKDAHRAPGHGSPANLPKRTMTLKAVEYGEAVLPKPENAREVRLQSNAARALAAAIGKQIIDGELITDKEDTDESEEDSFQPAGEQPVGEADGTGGEPGR